VVDGARFCAHCGIPVVAPEPVPAAPPQPAATPWGAAPPPPSTQWHAPPSGTGVPLPPPPQLAPYPYTPPQLYAAVRPVNRALAVWTQVVSWVAAASFIVTAIAALHLRSVADHFYKTFGASVDPQFSVSGRRWIDAENLAAGLFVVSVIASVGVAVLLIIWTYKVTRAVNRHQGVRRSWTPGWAVGGWFIPLANYVLPQLVLMEDERIATAAAQNQGDASHWATVRHRWVTIVLWFVCWAIGTVLTTIGTASFDNATYVPLASRTEVDTFCTLMILGCCFSAAAVALAAITVRRITNADHGKIRI
jgi:hypothetical protein